MESYSRDGWILPRMEWMEWTGMDLTDLTIQGLLSLTNGMEWNGMTNTDRINTGPNDLKQRRFFVIFSKQFYFITTIKCVATLS